MCRSSSEGYDVACFMGLVPVWGKGKWERRTGTKLLAVLLQHICCEVNTPKGVVPTRRGEGDKVTGQRGASEHERLIPQTRCQHKLLSVVPVVSVRVEGGYVSRCLLCGSVGPVRDNGESARRVLMERGVSEEESSLRRRVSVYSRTA
jgi:hypothetical protein